MYCDASKMQDPNQLNIELEIPFQNKRLAQIAYEVLRLDEEPRRSGVRKEIVYRENLLLVTFSADLARHLRVAVNGFFDKLDLVSETFEAFGPPVSETYDYY